MKEKRETAGSKSLTCPLSQEIEKEASKQLTLLKQLPKEKRNELWIAERIAYQIGWGQLLLYWYNTGIQGKNPEMPGDGFTKWNYKDIAEYFYKKYLYDQGPEQEKRFQAIISEVLAIVEKEYQTGNLDECGVWPWCTLPSGKDWPLSKWVRVNTISPWKATSTLLKKHL